jgi:hypothetical protein
MCSFCKFDNRLWKRRVLYPLIFQIRYNAGSKDGLMALWASQLYQKGYI